MEFVINLSSECYGSPYNEYGYWSGKTYKNSEEVFPACDKEITFRTKRYKNKRRAEAMARKLLDRCAYVTTWEIETID